MSSAAQGAQACMWAGRTMRCHSRDAARLSQAETPLVSRCVFCGFSRERGDVAASMLPRMRSYPLLHQSLLAPLFAAHPGACRRLLGCSESAHPLLLNVIGHDVLQQTSTASAQDVAELMRWLGGRGVSGPAFKRLRKRLRSPHSFQHQPSVATAQANFASLRDVLHMDDEQARSQRRSQPEHHVYVKLVSAAAVGGGESDPSSGITCRPRASHA